MFLQSISDTSWSEVRTQALQASETALELDPDSASIHINYAHIRGVWEGDQKTARQHYRNAIELEPNNSFSLLHYGAHLASSGEVEKGLPFLQRAMILDPLSGEVSLYLARALASLGRLGDASKALEHGLKFNPNYLHLRISEVSGLTAFGDLTTAFTRLRDLAVMDPHHFQVQESVIWRLVAILRASDTYDPGRITTLNSHALLGVNTNSVDYFRSRSGQLNDQTILKTIRDNGFGLYNSLLANQPYRMLDD